MIEQQITLCSNGRAVLSGYSGGLLLGYAHNTGVYRLRVVCSGEWDGTTVCVVLLYLALRPALERR